MDPHKNHQESILTAYLFLNSCVHKTCDLKYLLIHLRLHLVGCAREMYDSELRGASAACFAFAVVLLCLLFVLFF